jgi:hypothetical protein
MVWALANIAGDTVEYRDHIISYGTIEILCDLLRNIFETQESISTT